MDQENEEVVNKNGKTKSSHTIVTTTIMRIIRMTRVKSPSFNIIKIVLII